MTAVAPGIAPGIYESHQLPADAYHADPALSSSGARQLLAECPAKFAYDREHGGRASKAMDFGTAAHLAVLGAGPDLVIVDAPDYRSKQAQQQRDEARAEGAIPLLPHEWDHVQAMAEAIRQHPVAGPLFAPGSGRAEVSLFWTDPDTGVDCRARIDWLRHPVAGRRLLIPDYKTTTDASPRGAAKAVAEYGYHMQADWYTEAVETAGLAPDGAVFLLVLQEKSAPYLVTVVQLDATALMLAGAKNAAARRLFADCSASGRWPGYADEPLTISLPAWAEIRDEEYL